MDIPGYAGQILYVDLTYGEIRKEALDPGLANDFIGGWGINAKLAYDLIPPDADSLSSENAIIIGAGLFPGTIVPGSAELSITTKLPLSEGIGTGCGGGHFSLMLKASGYDHVVITGKAPSPVYLKIFNDDIELCDARELWGRDTYETVDALQTKYQPCSVIPIGPAGENLVKISVTFIDKGGTVGYGGLPAVMGSKNLKAVVACQGDRGIRVADRAKLLKKVNQIMERVMSYRMRPVLIEGGTFAMTKGWAADMGMSIDGWNEIHTKARKTLACPSCPMGDKEVNRIIEGEYAPMRAYFTDFMMEAESSGSTPLDNHNRAVKRVDTMNRTGVCNLHFYSMLDQMISLYDQKIITKEDTGGIEIKHDYETVLKLINMTAHRQGFGDVIAEGPLWGARKIGPEAEEQAIHIKGCAPFVDPRQDSMSTMALAQMVHPGRPNYACGGVGIYMQGRPLEQFIFHAHRMGMNEKHIGRIFSAEAFNTGRLTRHAEDWYSLFNCFGQCHRLYIHRFHSIDGFIELYSAITGMEADAASLLKKGERVWNMMKLLNVRLGFRRTDDRSPDAFFQPKKIRGREMPMMDYFKNAIITKEDTERMLDNYYNERGWDKETGEPSPEKLKELGLENL